jgi:ABC-type transporter Mla MlaB component
MANYILKNNRITLHGPLTIAEVGPLYQELIVLVQTLNDGSLELDLSPVAQMDSAGVAMIDLLVKAGREKGLQATVISPEPRLQRTMAAFSLKENGKKTAVNPTTRFERMGEFAATRSKDVLEFLSLTADSVYYAAIGLINRKKST